MINGENHLHEVYISLGSNIGDKKSNLQKAIALISIKCEVVAQSSLYETAPWGNINQDNFVNQVIYLKTLYSPKNLMTFLLAVESEMGRIREDKWGPRTIDLDILFYDDVIIDEEKLKVPHPQISARKFILTPMAELSQSLIHPVLNKTINSLLAECSDNSEVKLI